MILPSGGESMLDLLWKFNKLFFKELKRRFELPFHPKRFPFLFVIVKNPGIKQIDIAHILNVEPPTVAITLKRMEKDGLVVRKVSETDRRALEVYPTEKARKIFEKMEKIKNELEKEVLSVLSDEEVHHLEKSFKKMVDYLSGRES
jgi:DNA-binding MarR family transcriptional regulator